MKVVPLAMLVVYTACARVLNAGRAREAKGDLNSRECVVLIHGLGRTAWSMKGLEWDLKKQGYQVTNKTYPSTRVKIEEAAEVWLRHVLELPSVRRAARVHFVTHSAGGIVLRQYLSRHAVKNLGRVIMLAPPNQGSEVADRLRDNGLFKRLTGPTGQELGTGTHCLPRRLPPANYEAGVIAGNLSLNPLFSAWLPGPDDGKGAVTRAALPGMAQMLVVRRSHTWMMWGPDVKRAVARFLREGRFGE
jgi:pimeloyl-ACP methyl ester carboxylesterase